MSVFVLSGCVNVKKDSIEDITNYVISNQRKMINHVNRGYKYYVPRGLSVSYKNELNEVIRSSKYEYYLYVDLVSYYNKTELTNEINENIYYSKHIKGEDGIINITQKDKKYLIQIEYNYARIEVLVNKADLKMAVSNALIMVSSIDYNDETIRAMLDEGVLSLNEKPVNVFKNNDENNRTDLLEIEDDNYYEEDYRDRDYIN
jgi:hypothetical protein